MKKNVASQVIGAQMISATDGSAFTGSVTVYVTGDAGTQAIGSVGSGVCTHEGNGFHTYAPAQAETNYDHVAFTFIGTGAIPSTIQIFTAFPQTGDAFARLGAPVGASISADVAAVQSDTDNIQTRIPAALVSGRMDANVGALANDAITAASIAADAGTEIGTAVWASTTRVLTAGTNIALAKGTGVTGFNDLDAAGVRGAVGLAAANLDTQIGTLATGANLATVAGYLDTEIAAILADTNELQTDWANGGRLDNILDARASQTSVDAVAGYIDTEVSAIKAVTDKVDTTLEIAAGSPGDYRFSADALHNAPAGSGGGSAPTAAQIADAVWDEILSGHAVAGSTGEALSAAGASGDPWITALPGSYSAGQAGYIIGTNLDATVSSRATQASVDTVDDFLDTEIAAIKAKTDNLPSDPADASDVAASFSAVNTKLDTIDDFLDTEVAAIKAKTDNLPASPAATSDIPTATQNADALLNRDMSAVSDTNARSPLNALRFIRNKWSIAGTTLTVTKEDDATSAWTATVTAAPGADPISGNDPT